VRDTEFHSEIAIVVFDGVQALNVAGPMDVFAAANNLLAPEQHYQVTLVGMRPGAVRCANGLELKVDTDYLQYEEQPDMLLVAGESRLPDLRPEPGFVQWLSAKAQASRRYGSTCAGVTAGVDLCLAVVTQDWGPEMSLRIARQLIVCIRRDGGQSPYSPFPAVGPKEETIVAKVLRHVTDHISEHLSIEQLADAVAVSRRTFSRIFAKNARMTPSAFVEQVRVDFSRKLLEETDLPLKTVAFRCGFHSANHMRVIFARRLDTTPRDYRQRFRNKGLAQTQDASFDLSMVSGAHGAYGASALHALPQ
jgi:transcriptional regulator GlxA family with amidase domain